MTENITKALIIGIVIGVLIEFLIIKSTERKYVLIEGLSAHLPVGVYNSTVLDLDKMYKSGGVR